MANPKLTQPLVFQPIFVERIWGGRRIESLYGKRLPPAVRIGESWEIVDRPEAQSVVATPSVRGVTLNQLWTQHRTDVFGTLPDTPRFPILAKILDARENLSLQVHPPPAMANELGGEPKSEFWFVADAAPNARIFAGLGKGSTRSTFVKALREGTVLDQTHQISVKTGDAIFLPSGRIHAIGAGNVIIEIQQNSDTTYRIYDWDRVKEGQVARTMHVTEALQCIDFSDREPPLLDCDTERLITNSLFTIEKWRLHGDRESAPRGTFAIIVNLSGHIECSGVEFKAGDFFLVPAELENRLLRPKTKDVLLLRVTTPV